MPKLKPVRCWAVIDPSYQKPWMSWAGRFSIFATRTEARSFQDQVRDGVVVRGAFVPDPPKKTSLMAALRKAKRALKVIENPPNPLNAPTAKVLGVGYREPKRKVQR